MASDDDDDDLYLYALALKAKGESKPAERGRFLGQWNKKTELPPTGPSNEDLARVAIRSGQAAALHGASAIEQLPANAAGFIRRIFTGETQDEAVRNVRQASMGVFGAQQILNSDVFAKAAERQELGLEMENPAARGGWAERVGAAVGPLPQLVVQGLMAPQTIPATFAAQGVSEGLEQAGDAPPGEALNYAAAKGIINFGAGYAPVSVFKGKNAPLVSGAMLAFVTGVQAQADNLAAKATYDPQAALDLEELHKQMVVMFGVGTGLSAMAKKPEPKAPDRVYIESVRKAAEEAGVDLGEIEVSPVKAEPVKTAEPVAERKPLEEMTVEELHADVKRALGEEPQKTEPTEPHVSIVEPGPETKTGAPETPPIEAAPAQAAEPTPTPPTEPPMQIGTAPDKATSLKNRIVDLEAAAEGAEAPEHGPRRPWKQVQAEAEQAFVHDPQVGAKLLDDMLATDRPFATDTESAILLREKVRLINERMALEEQRNLAASEGDLSRADSIDAQIKATKDRNRQLDEVATKAGTPAAQILAIRNMEQAMDYTFPAIERRIEVARDGAPLDPEGPLYKDLYEKAKAVAKAELEVETAKREKRVSDLEATVQSLQADRPVRMSVRANKIQRVKVSIEETWKRIDALTATARAGPLDPALLKEVATLAKQHIELGIHNVAQFADALGARYEKIKPYVEEAWKQAETGMAAGDDLSKAARHLINQGVKNSDVLVSKLHELRPDLTRDQVIDKLTNYGKTKPLNKAADLVALRRMKGEQREVRKLIDVIENARAPAKTGLERQPADKAERQLSKEVYKAMKRLGITTVDAEKQLQTALETAKKRVLTQIEAREQEIKTGQKPEPKDTKEGPKDAELEALLAKRDELDGVIESMKPKQRGEKQLRKQIAELDRKIAAGDLSAKKSGRATVDTEEVAALKAERAEKQKLLDYERKQARPKLTPEQMALKARELSLDRRLNKLGEQLTYGDYSKPQRKEPISNPALREKELLLADLRAQIDRKIAAEEWKHKTGREKALHAAKEIVNSTTSIAASGDLSATFNQGLMLTLERPDKVVTDWLPKAVEAFMSKKNAQRMDYDMRQDPDFNKLEQIGVKFSSLEHGHGVKEADFRGRVSEKIPIIAGSGRAMTTYLNAQRLSKGKALLRGAGENVSLEQAKAIANAVNVFTGVGNAGKYTNALRGANTVFWSPSLNLARFQTLTMQPLFEYTKLRPRGDRYTRAEIAKTYARAAVSVVAAYSLLAQAGVNVTLNPKSSQFGDIEWGDWHINPIKGLASMFRFFFQQATGERETQSGAEVPIRGKGTPYGQTGFDLFNQWWRGKLAPPAGVAVDLIAGTKYDRKTEPTVMNELPYPISPKDMFDAFRKEGLDKATALSIMSILGISVQDYERTSRN